MSSAAILFSILRAKYWDKGASENSIDPDIWKTYWLNVNDEL